MSVCIYIYAYIQAGPVTNRKFETSISDVLVKHCLVDQSWSKEHLIWPQNPCNKRVVTV